ncbi:MAG: DUF6273 domain-containing protein [Lachnospiraceae bacterium]|jgi:hypothetical protein|nr:DUF6273 domain-containing protein [Lachnospiraceae bacterium]
MAGYHYNSSNQKPGTGKYLFYIALVMFFIFAILTNFFGRCSKEVEPISAEAIKETHEAESEIEEAVNFKDDPAKQMNDALMVIKEQQAEGIVENYRIYDDSIEVNYASQITYIFMPIFNDLALFSSGSGTKTSVVMGSALEVITPSVNWNDDLISGVESAENAIRATDDFSIAGLFNENTTLEALEKELKGHDIVIWSGHGGYSQTYGPILLTGEKKASISEIETSGGVGVSNEWKARYEDYPAKRIVDTSTQYYAITSKFIDYYYEPGDFSDCVFFFASCHAGETNTLANSLTYCGAKTVVGFDYAVLQSYGNDMCQTFFEELTKKDSKGNYVTDAQTALENAITKNGKQDVDTIFEYMGQYLTTLINTYKIFTTGELPNITGRVAHPVLFGDGSFMLSTAKENAAKAAKEDKEAKNSETGDDVDTDDSDEDDDSDSELVTYGTYNDKPLKWRILAREGDKVLLITNECLEHHKYHDEREEVTWEDSDVRAWLNDEFLNSFTDEEKKHILTTTLKNNDNPTYGSNGGKDTKDKVFLLSIDEAIKYFANDKDRIAKYTGDESWWIAFRGKATWWFLRTPGYIEKTKYTTHYRIAGVWEDGSIDEVGIGGAVAFLHEFSFDKGHIGPMIITIRPAMWVDKAAIEE